MRATLDLLAILAASVAHFISGITLVNIGRVHTRLFSGMDMELPLISKAATAYTATAAPIVTGLALGLGTLVGLGLVFRSEKSRWLLPFLLTLSFIAVLLHIMFVSFGVTLPLVGGIHTMEQ